MVDTGDAFLGIMAKAPRPGHSKTRLTQGFAPETSADLYKHFLLDTALMTEQVPGVRRGIICPAGDTEDLEALDLGLEIHQQPVPGLMQGLAFAIDSFLGQGHWAVMLINADSPTLPPEALIEALARLQQGDEVVLGPTADGGYYLIGATVGCHDLLCGAPYASSATITQDTKERARQLGLRIGEVSAWFDVDLPGEVLHLEQHLEALPLEVASHTRRALTRYKAELARLRQESEADH